MAELGISSAEAEDIEREEQRLWDEGAEEEKEGTGRGRDPEESQRNHQRVASPTMQKNQGMMTRGKTSDTRDAEFESSSIWVCRLKMRPS